MGLSKIGRKGIQYLQNRNTANVSNALLETGQNRVIDASLTLIREKAKLKGELIRALGGAVASASALGVPLGHNSSFLQGPAFAPPRIREAIWCGSTNSSTEEGKEMKDPRVFTDVGDLPVQEIRDCGVDDDRLMNVVSESVKLVMEEDPLRPIVLGGDHSISFPVVRAVSEKLGGPVDILHLDAHPDIYHCFEGNKYSHASSFARIMEGGYARRLLQVGIRSINPEGREQGKKFGVEQYEMRTFSRDRHFLENLKLGEGVKGVYISIDVDCLDPAFAPGVSHIEPGGLSFRWNIEKIGYCAIKCRLAKAKESTSSKAKPATLIKEPHKYFDQVIITVRAGDGGHGAVLNMPNQESSSKSQRKQDKENKWKKSSFKRDFDGSVILPMGGHGGDVVIYADEGKDSLLEFHEKSRYNAKRGGNVDAMGVSSQIRDGLKAPTLRIPVPVGTAVKRKRGKLLADLARPGDEILVARGGQGGISLLAMPQHGKKKMMNLTTNVMRDDSDKVLVLGQPGEEVSLELILRVVADVGLVGLPNAGKSTLLAAITLAKPDIADYPFTTLMPNLGRLDGDPSLGAAMYSSEATLADLPGLIEGAHLGKGLGRNFLRHLRRTRLLVHVVDAAAEDPVKDYKTVKEELRMYNANYLERPYIVVLNKIDIPEARDRLPYLTEEILRIGCEGTSSAPEIISDAEVKPLSPEGVDAILHSSGVLEEDRKDKQIEDYPRPLAVVGVSVLKGIKINEMLKEIRAALRKCNEVQHLNQVDP